MVAASVPSACCAVLSIAMTRPYALRSAARNARASACAATEQRLHASAAHTSLCRTADGPTAHGSATAYSTATSVGTCRRSKHAAGSDTMARGLPPHTKRKLCGSFLRESRAIASGGGSATRTTSSCASRRAARPLGLWLRRACGCLGGLRCGCLPLWGDRRRLGDGVVTRLPAPARPLMAVGALGISPPAPRCSGCI
eukprot:5145317-Prymnesium_polylepis.1